MEQVAFTHVIRDSGRCASDAARNEAVNTLQRASLSTPLTQAQRERIQWAVTNLRVR